MDDEQRCGTCTWFRPIGVSEFSDGQKTYGMCGWTEAHLPYIFQEMGLIQPYADQGTTCPTYAKEMD